MKRGRLTIRATVERTDGIADTWKSPLLDVPSRLDDSLLILLGMGLAFDHSWCKDDIILTIKQNHRVLYRKEF